MVEATAPPPPPPSAVPSLIFVHATLPRPRVWIYITLGVLGHPNVRMGTPDDASAPPKILEMKRKEGKTWTLQHERHIGSRSGTLNYRSVVP